MASKNIHPPWFEVQRAPVDLDGDLLAGGRLRQTPDTRRCSRLHLQPPVWGGSRGEPLTEAAPTLHHAQQLLVPPSSPTDPCPSCSPSPRLWLLVISGMNLGSLHVSCRVLSSGAKHPLFPLAEEVLEESSQPWFVTAARGTHRSTPWTRLQTRG